MYEATYLSNLHYKKPKALIICRAGDSSLHKNWLSKSNNDNFDLVISYYGDKGNLYVEDCVYYEKQKGTKFPSLYKLISNNIKSIMEYDIIWIADDDLLINNESINRMFNIFYSKKLWLAQPSLTHNSYYSYPLTLKKEGLLLRYTNFVEEMAPIFSREALLRCLYSFSESQSGWGLDLIWPKILGYPTNKIAIIDAVSVHHTRKIWTGPQYKLFNIDPWTEATMVTKKYDVPLPYDMKVYGEVRS
ncbi:DUF707 domain-containing protein [Oceanirhabdus sp. W0125-5]|uniref:DUF707 domain-containing protein n=1 Tax=Oceanirhabdus sp. W0125-5 TaxID=2999116 RepID=UPI0022F311E0|nr:DUF707 domain-containing protein [Oceanirhabdus sp. W0125-5]WBW96648.1 DUF707 domain-containing protein [Oceanirhabdus sp. W0125-5]